MLKFFIRPMSVIAKYLNWGEFANNSLGGLLQDFVF